ncbi:MAG: serine/threonine protein kinase, partial [Nannocystaceae bacterium]|nr:serine/threonine protein kinase [Nannocystaceae bacterium]
RAVYPRGMPGPRVPPSEAPTILPPEGWGTGGPHASTFPGATHETSPGEGASLASTADPRARVTAYEPGMIIAETFRVERELGSGAMGVVLLATHLALDRRVALKVHRADNPADVSRLAREAKALAKVQHPNVVGIYDVRESGGSLFIAMEYIQGESGRPWMSRGELSWRARLDVCFQAARGLHAAHTAGLVHRDFKPENILIGADGRVLVADFGLARTPGAVPIDPATPSPGVDAQLTAVGAVTGTPAYMSPEQWQGGAVDARSDVFALSVVIYEALYGRRPFAGSTPGELAYAITRGMLRVPPTEIKVPKAVFDVLRRGMAVSPGQRFGSVTMLVRALESAVSAPGRAGVALAFGMALLVFAGIGGVAWALKTSDPTQGPAVFVTDAAEADDEEEADDVEPVAAALPSTELQARPRPKRPDAVVASRQELPQAPPDEPLGPSKAEIQAATDHNEDVSERYSQGEATHEEMISAIQALHAIQRRTRDRPYTRTPWDGTSTLVCPFGERVEVRDADAKLETGVAIKMEMGCGLKLVNVNIEAPVAIEGTMSDRLVIEGGTFTVSRKGIAIGMSEVDISDLRIEGEALVGAEFGMHTLGRIANSTFEGLTAIRVGMHSDLALEGGRMSGKTAVDAQVGSTVRIQGTELEGKVKRGPKALVER